MSVAREYRWMSFDDIVSDAAERLKDVSNHEIPPETLAQWATQACREFARRSESVRGTYLAPLVLGQKFYRLPADCLRIRQVAVTIPGYSGELTLPYVREEELLDGSELVQGTPWAWYLTPDRSQLGLVSVPTTGGADDYTTGNGLATTLVCSRLSDSDDVYVGMTVKILQGMAMGETSTVTAYNGTTHTVTVSPAFSVPILADLRFQIYPDTLRIEYIRIGNSFTTRPGTVYNISGPAANHTHTYFRTDLPERQPDYWVGKEIRFTTGTLADERTRIITSEWSGALAATTVDVHPELLTRPTSSDDFLVTDVPNIPDAFHSALVDYIVHLGLVRNGTPDPQHYNSFLEKVNEALTRDLPVQGQEFEQVRQYGRGEYEWWEE